MVKMINPKTDDRHYNAWLQLNVLSLSICNMNCVYCFKNEHGQRPGLNEEVFPGGIYSVAKSLWHKIVHASKMSPLQILQKLKLISAKSKMQTLDIPAFMRSLENAQKIFRISFTGGDPFLVPNIVEACIKITEKHFVSFNTNLVAGHIQKFIHTIDPKRVLRIHASLHFKELERLKKTKLYIENFLLAQEKGFPIFSGAVAYPPLVDEVDQYRKSFGAYGITFTFFPFKGTYKGKIYPESYTAEEREKFGFDESFLDKFHTFGRTCNAGVNVGVVSSSGVVYPCYDIYEEIGNIYGEINFKKEITVCPKRLCSCPLYYLDELLYEEAILQTSQNWAKPVSLPN